MSSLLAAGAAFFWREATAATPAFVRSATANRQGNGGALTTSAVNTASGNLFVVAVTWDGSNVNMNVTDNKGNTYTPASAKQLDSRHNQLLQTFYVANGNGGTSHTFTATPSAPASWVKIIAHEVSGVSKTSPLDKFAAINNEAGAPVTVGPVTTTTNGQYIFGVINNDSGNNTIAPTTGSGYTERATSGNGNGELQTQDMVQSTAGTISSNWTMSGTNHALAQIATFKADVSVPDTTAPSVPAGLTALPASATQVNLSWNASTDNVGVTGYRIYRDGTQIATSTATSYQNTGLAQGTTYSYTVAAYDAAGNVSAQSGSASATTPTPDTQAPTVPDDLTATAVSTTAIDLSWSASTDNVGVVGYRIYRNDTLWTVTSATSIQDTGLTQGTTYSYTVAAYDAANNASAQSAPESATTLVPPPDTTAPSVPNNLSATTVSNTQVFLAWSASSDNVGVTGYRIYRDGVSVGTTSNTSYTDTGLSPGITYNFTVAAYDAANNTSAQSQPVSVTTPAPSSFNFPYPVTTSNRQFRDQNGNPYLLKTMSSWAMGQEASNTEITQALEGLKALGFNAATVAPFGVHMNDTFGNRYQNDAGQNFFTGAPFASGFGPAWSSMDWVMQEASRLQMTIVFSTFVSWADTGTAPDIMNAGTTNTYNFGQALAQRYAQYPNIVWHVMGDYVWYYGQNISEELDAMFHGIKDAEGGTHRLVISEPSQGQNVTGYEQFIAEEQPGNVPGYQWFKQSTNPLYNYGANAVDQFDAIYNEAGATSYPVWDSEPPYVNAPHYPGNANQQLRERNYATFIRGGVGINFGHEKWWPFGVTGIFDGGSGWLGILTQAPQLQAQHAWTLLDSFVDDPSWQPDTGNTFLKTGLGSGDTKAASGYANNSALVYFPSNRTASVDTTVLNGTNPVRLRWYDPTTGTYSTIAAAEAQTASRSLNFPANHSDGTSDWVLVVDLTAPDTQAPTTPANLSVTGTTLSQVSLSWTASTDNIGISNYKVYRNGTLTGTTAATNFTDTNLTAGTTYTYTVSAVDSSNNESAQSTGVPVTTQAPDTTAPSVPQNVTAPSATTSQISLSWNASTDNVAVTGYLIFRNGIQVGTTAITSFTDTGLTANTSYTYKVSAVDAANNVSPQSAEISASTLALPTSAFPASTSNRKILDQNGNVFLMRTFSSWAMAQHLTDAEITTALEDVKDQGFNAVTVWAGGGYSLGPSWNRYTTAAHGDWWTGTPWQSDFGPGWEAMDRVMDEALRLGITVNFSFCGGNGTSGARPDWQNATDANMHDVGVAVANRYPKSAYPNLVWHVMFDDQVLAAVPRVNALFDGINDTEGAAARPVRWAEVYNGASLYNVLIQPNLIPNFAPSMNGFYDNGYGSTVWDNGAEMVEASYNEAGATSYPTGNTEATYDGSPYNVPGNAGQNLREQSLAVFLEGGSYINYSHEDWWPFGATSWVTSTEGITWDQVPTHGHTVQQSYIWSLLDSFVDDPSWQPHNSFVVTGTGSGDTKAAVGASTSAAIAYFPTSRSVTIDTTIISGTGPVRLRWYDPTTGQYSTISSTEAQNANRSVSYPSNHIDGTSDWVLVVDGEATPDTLAPSVPSGLNVSSVTESQVNLAWTASTDDISVSNYKIYRNGTLTGTTSGTTFTDTNLSAGTTYTFTVSAVDTSNNESAQSSGVQATTQAPDTTAPSVPTGLNVQSVGSNQISLSWTASSDNVAVTGYRVYRNGVSVGTTNITSFTNTGLSPNTIYSFTVAAYDAANNTSAQSGSVNGTTSNTPAATPAFKQLNYSVPASNQTTVTTTFNQAQVAGNLNVLLIGWNNATSNIVSVSDSAGNTYEIAAPTARGSNISQAVYYAKNIKAATAGSNRVTVTFNTSTPYIDLRIAEYSGVDTVTPFVATSSSSGTNSAATSGAVTTQHPTTLLVGAGMTQGEFTSSGSGFTTRVITNPNSDIVSDRIVTSIGSYSATATNNGGGFGSAWVMQVVAFKAAGQ